MYPTHHAGLTALALLPLRRRGWTVPQLGLFAAASVLIDADHYLSYVYRTGDWSLFNAYRWHAGRISPFVRRTPRFHCPPFLRDDYRPLHALAPLALFALAARRWPALWPLVWGMLFHRLLDYSLELFKHPSDPASGGAARPSDATHHQHTGGVTCQSAASRHEHTSGAPMAGIPEPHMPREPREAREPREPREPCEACEA